MKKNEGFYNETAPLIRTTNDKAMSIYRDTATYFNEEQMYNERRMVIDGQTFLIKSVFPEDVTSTPSEQLLKLIDLDSKKVG